jgi:hypothetical protein
MSRQKERFPLILLFLNEFYLNGVSSMPTLSTFIVIMDTFLHLVMRFCEIISSIMLFLFTSSGIVFSNMLLKHKNSVNYYYKEL